MPLKRKYLKYKPEITFEIFTLVWNKLKESYIEFYKNGCNEEYSRFVNKKAYIMNLGNEFGVYYSIYDQTETTVQEILGYDPFIKEDFVLPEKWCIKVFSDKTPKEVYNWRKDVLNAGDWSNTGYILNYGLHIQKKDKDYTEITLDQFKKYVLKDNNEIAKEKVIEEVIPEYVECINSTGTVILKVDMIYKVLSKEFCSCGTSWYLLENVNLKKRCTCGNSAPSNAYNPNRFKLSTKEAFDAQNQPKQPLKQAVHCKTQEEWDFVTEKCNFTWKNDNFPKAKNNCIIISNNTWDSVETLTKLGNYQILSFQEWCDLNGYKMENGVKFEVGKWYLIKTAYDWIIKFKEIKGDSIKAYWSCTSTCGSKVEGGGSWGSKPTEIKDLSIEEVQQYLPDNHPDKIKSNQEFKIGDFVICSGNIHEYSKSQICRLTEIGKNINNCRGRFKFLGNNNEESESIWLKNYIRHATPEEINNHLISIGQIPAGEPLNAGIEPNKDGAFKYTIYSGPTHIGKTSTISGPLKMTLSIDDEELPMVNIIKTNTIKQLLNND